ncbi:PaREP1 family protein [Thermofilum pendens]|uniref:PaREP8 domain containing protein n=1 Tax=Thermofilum pendens (strain DSM 2475 / Hrk 5) TaxID=368408 RepID=A1S031_THEPD|nr:PaREP1 family protein [Thermofilum pendens]ABL78811.1 PaREP8 domain containing protein [Thermofilum pendens Hrk 5]
MLVAVSLPRVLVERARREAERLGVSLEEYFLEVISGNLDPRDKAEAFIEASKELLEGARKELGKGDVRQAAEKVWVAVALAVKAYAYAKEGKRLASHGDLWRYKEVLVSDLGEWVRDSWAYASSMHTCFYEGWCTEKDVEVGISRAERLVGELEGRVKEKLQA